MANDNNLNIEVTASVQGLKEGLQQSETAIKSFGNEANKMASQTNKMSGAVQSNAIPTLTSFSQVIQDAPYGIRGVANNITQLTSQFGYLSKSTGGAGAAIKTMIGSLIGPAGILLAVSAVTSLMVSYEGNLFKSKTAAEKLTEQHEKLTKSLEDYEKGLSGVNKASLQGGKDAAKELTNLQLLKAQVDNVNLSNEERIKAVNELQKKYPSYLGNITDEDALVGGLDIKYNELAEAIMKSARAQAAAKLISENYQKQLVLEAQLSENALKIAEDKVKAEAFASQALKQSQTISGAGTQTNIELNKKYNNQVEKGYKTQATLVGEITKLQTDSLNLTKKISDLGGVVPLDFKVETAKAKVNGLVDGIKSQLATSLQGVQMAVTPIVNTISTTLANVVPKPDLMANRLALMGALLSQFNENASYIIQNGIAETFMGLGHAIGEALATGGNVLEAVGASLLSSLGNILIQMGEMAISIGVSLIGIKKALSSLNPAVAIAAGVALIALGSFFASKSKSIGGSIGGGGGGSDFSGSKGNYGSSTSGFSGGGNSGGTYVFEIAGTKLIGVLKNTLDRNKALGGTNLVFG